MFENPLKRNTGKTADSSENTHARETAPQTRPQSHATTIATVGPSIHFKGDLSGEEDLVIQGTVEGTINLKQHNLIIGQEGKVNANVHAHTITVEGSLKGDVYGEEKVIIKKSGNVQGNISAPRVSLEDGAKFKGSMDMEQKRSESAVTRNDTSSASVFKLDKTPGVEKAGGYEAKGAAK